MLEKTLAELEKKFGEGVVFRLGSNRGLDIDVVPTGSLTLDIATGIGGFPLGRMVEVYGPESSGKTTLCQHTIIEAQKLDYHTAFIDMEHAFDPKYFADCGGDVGKLYISQPDSGEQALGIVEALITSGEMRVIVVDSIASLVPLAEIEGEMGDSHMGLQARLMSQACRKLTPLLKKNNVCLVWTNQIRHKIGGFGFGSPEVTTGGNAMKFYASMRLDIRRIQSIKDGGKTVANRVKVKVKKNKLASPFREAEFDIIYGEGISKEGDIRDLGVQLGVLEKRGAYYRYGDTLLGQGKEAVRLYLKEHAELAREIECKIKEKK